jgi:hypothetical protein
MPPGRLADDGHRAVGLVRDPPAGERARAAEQAIDHRRRPRQPAAAVAAQARVVEDHGAAGCDERVPAVPVGLRALFGVVAVDEDEVDLAAPARADHGAVVDVPGHPRAAVTATCARDHPPARALRRPPSGGQRQDLLAERVDEVKLGARLEDLAQHDGGRALVDADLDHATPPRRRHAQHVRVGPRVHRARRDQAGADEQST